MNTAIATLRKRIELLNKEYEKAYKTFEETDNKTDYFSAIDYMVNILNECAELQDAIGILEQYNYITKEQ